MLKHLAANTRVLIVPGLHGSGAEHWQSRWQQRYPSFERVVQRRWDLPELDVWADQVAQVLQRSNQPTVIVAHSFGCLATVRCITRLQRSQQLLQSSSSPASPVVAALLVAPADPVKFGVADALRQGRLPFPSTLVGSTNDPWMSANAAAAWAGQWGSHFVNAGALGHINAESGLGDWPEGMALLANLSRDVEQAA
ncbi:MAG: alpha/beta hydrolase [Pseudomonadota bacterium]